MPCIRGASVSFFVMNSILPNIIIPSFKTKSGHIQDVNLSYEVFGKPLGSAPVVLVIHALTGNSNVCGPDGWWVSLIGEGKCIDTNRYSVLAFNLPGNGYDCDRGSIIETYKAFTAFDVAVILNQGLEKLNISNLYAGIGGSVGGGVLWELAVLNPDLIEHIIPVASDWKSPDWVIANCFIQDNILNNSSRPLYDARLHAMTLYRTPESFTKKFDRSFRSSGYYNIESWLNHHGDKLENRFSVAAYKMMNQLLKTIDVAENNEAFKLKAKALSGKVHIVTINSDLLFKNELNWQTYNMLIELNVEASIHEINSIDGHDAFLIEFEQMAQFLSPIFKIN